MKLLLKLSLPVFFLLTFALPKAQADFGYFLNGGSFVTVGGTSYQLGNPSPGAPIFHGTDFGTFTPGSSLILDGFQTFTFENNNDNAHSGRLDWNVTGGGGNGTINATGFSDLGGGNNLHEATGAGINLLDGLGPGSYQVLVHTELDATYNGNTFPQDDDTIWHALDGMTIYENLSGRDAQFEFVATFTVQALAIPEPTTIVPFCFGAMLLTRRRRFSL